MTPYLTQDQRASAIARELRAYSDGDLERIPSLSPPHLALFSGGLLVATTGIRAMWAKPETEPSFKEFVPVLLSAILFIGIAGFITMYLSAFMTDVAPTTVSAMKPVSE